MKDILTDIWIPLVLLIALIIFNVVIYIVHSVPFNIWHFLAGFCGGLIGSVLYYWRNQK